MNYLSIKEKKEQDKILNAKELKDIAVVILNNLGNLGLDDVQEIRNVIDFSPIANYARVFKTVEEYYDKNRGFPDISVLESKHANLVFPTSNTYNSEIFIYFINSLRDYKQIADIQAKAAEFDIEGIKAILSNERKMGTIEPDITFDNLLDVYKTQKNSPGGLMTGISQIDTYLGGMDYGTFHVIAAPVGNFKTTTAISMAYNASMVEGKKVLYITLEVPLDKVYYDYVSRHAFENHKKNINAYDLKKKKLSSEAELDFETLLADIHAKEKNGTGKFTVVGAGDIRDYSFSGLEKMFLQIREQHGGLDVIVLDYLNLLKTKTPSNIKLDLYQILNFYANFLNEMAIKHKFIMLVLAQINREGTQKMAKVGEDGDVGMSSISTTYLAEANELERSATSVIVQYSSTSMKANKQVNMFLLKNRDGRLPESPITAMVEPNYFKVYDSPLNNGASADSILDSVASMPSTLDIDNFGKSDEFEFDETLVEDFDGNV